MLEGLNIENIPEVAKLTSPKLVIPDAINPGERLVTRKDAMTFLGISAITLQNYQRKGVLNPVRNTVNSRVYYLESDILSLLGSKKKLKREVVMYCRVSLLGSAKTEAQNTKFRLSQQIERLNEYCTRNGIRVDRVLTDIGPGTGMVTLPGYDKLIELIFRYKVALLVVETGDRLLRWGLGEVFNRFLNWHNVDLHIASPTIVRDEFIEEVKQDLSYIILDAKKILGEHSILQ